jgi:Flp pilus assembly protein TadD
MMLYLIIVLTGGLSLDGQFREYLIEGRVIDSEKKPIQSVVIELQEKETSRSFTLGSDGKGRYKFVGLPHGVYSVRFSKDGFREIRTEWDFHAPQERMQKVKMDDAVMLSSEMVEKMEKGRELSKKMESAKNLFDKKEFDGALALLTEIMQAYPDDGYAIFLAGMAWLGKGDAHSARPLFANLLEKDPSFADAHIQMGYCFQIENDLGQALLHYRQGDALKPNQFMVLYNIGMIQYQLDNSADAFAHLERALAFKQAEVDILETMALCKIKMKDYAAAVKLLEMALSKATWDEKRKNLRDMVDSLKKNLLQDQQ